MRHYIEFILKHRISVIVLTLLITAVLVLQAQNLKVIIDPNTMLPQSHPYVVGTNTVEKIFGSKYVIVIGITPKRGDIYQTEVLAKVQHITAALLQTPGVVKENLLSLTARRAKNIIGTADGLEVRSLMENVPKTAQQMAVLRTALHTNTVYLNTIVSNDERAVAVLAEFKDGLGGFRGMVDKVNRIIEKERDASVSITIGGLPVFLAHMEIYSERIAILFPLAILIVGLIHFEAFRTVQGLILPLATALLAVAWGLGVMGAAGIPMDVFNVSTPILILAVAAGHAVQLLKRYYEEYHRIRDTSSTSPRDANRTAVVESVSRIGPVMLIAGMVAAMGFLSLITFDMISVRVFGIFTAIGILSALVLEMTFIPALRSLLPAPNEKQRRLERAPRVWDRITAAIARWVVGRSSRKRLYVSALILVAIFFVGMTQVVVDNSTKDIFAKNLPFQQDDNVLNNQFGGTNTLYVMVQGMSEDAIKDPKNLQAIESTQRFIETQPFVGKTISLADFVKRMNQAMHGDDPAYYRVPESRELISQYLLLYSISGEPGDFDSYVDNGYQSANLTVYLKTDSSAYVQKLIEKIQAYTASKFGKDVRILIGGSVPQGAAIKEVIVRSKMLNIAQIGAVVFIISSIVFRSLLAGVFVLVPLVFAVLANFGLMGLSGIPLNIPNSLSSAMAVGIGADYAIYLIYRLREELTHNVDMSTAIRNVLSTAGKASLFVASAVAGGYGVLLFSYGFYVHTWMAILIANAMIVSVLASLTLIPALILTFRPRFIFKKPICN